MLALKEYISKLFHLTGKADCIMDEINYPSENTIKMYEEYKSGQMKELKVKENGELVRFEEIPHLTSSKQAIGSTAELWFARSDLKLYLLKSNTMIYDGNGSSFYTETNCILVPHIAKQFGLESAKYYLISCFNEEDVYMVTPDFKPTLSTELISGTTLVSETSDGHSAGSFDIRQMLNRIDKNLSLRKFEENEIEQVKRDFLKQCFFSKFCYGQDERNDNWGILLDEGHIKIAPLYDYEYCFGNRRVSKIERYVGDNKTDLSSFIIEFKDEEWFQEWVEKSFNNLDMNKAFEDAYQDTNVEISENTRAYYQKLINAKIEEVRTAINSLQKNEKEGEER